MKVVPPETSRSHSGRRTRQLDATYDVVQAAHDHPAAEQVHERVRRRLRRVSLGTVYRNLQKLAAEGRIRIVELGPRRTRFDGRLDEHEHFVCDACGSISDLPSNAGRLAGAARLRRAGFGIDRHTLTFFGLCPACRRVQG